MLNSKTARIKLPPRREPYWQRVEAGLYVGYRQPAGTWIARRRTEDGKQQYRSLGELDSLDAAVGLAKEWGSAVDTGASHRGTTVEHACRAYVTHQRQRKGDASAADAEARFRRLVYDQPIGRLMLDKLRTSHVREWASGTAGRNLNTLKAALNFALRDRLVASDAGWKTVARPLSTARRRERFLSAAERAALLTHCPSDLHALVTALLLTGARGGEIASAVTGDIDYNQGTLRLSGKTGARTVTLSTQALAFFKTQTKGKLPAAPVLTDAFNNAWNKDSWKKRFKAAVVAAGLPNDLVVYTLRHTAISELIAGGMDSFLVARLAGTSTTMIDKHYGHLCHQQTRARLDSVVLL